jgi:integrase
MASIENRSHFQVTVKHRDDLTKTFAHNSKTAAEEYCEVLKAQKLKPKLARLDNYYVVRDRSVSRKNQTLYASSASEAEEIKNKLEGEQQRSIFIDYATGFRTTFAELLIRYLQEEAPRHKSFEVVGTRMSQPSEASKFICKPFAQVVPEDFVDYIDERSQEVASATVDREIDIFSAVCSIAIDTWRIHVEKSPMDGVRRLRYYNERDRRLKSDEEERLARSAYEEDRKLSINARLEQLMSEERREADGATTVYRRKQVIRNARQLYLQEAENTYEHVPLLETFVHFQLMTGARRSETLTLTWSNVDLKAQTAYLPETKNGRARKLALRSDLINMLRQLPRTSELVFPIGVDGLRKAWLRICRMAGVTSENELRIHDLRHEAISRVAEAGSSTPGGFTLIDLQHFSGHRDVRMLLRYAHLCTASLAKRLDAAFASKSESVLHHGRRRLTREASVTLREIVNAPPEASTIEFSDMSASERLLSSSNVIRVNFARDAA